MVRNGDGGRPVRCTNPGCLVRWTAYDGNSCSVCGGPTEPDGPDEVTPTFSWTCEVCLDVSWRGPADEPCPFCGTKEHLQAGRTVSVPSSTLMM